MATRPQGAVKKKGKQTTGSMPPIKMTNTVKSMKRKQKSVQKPEC